MQIVKSAYFAKERNWSNKAYRFQKYANCKKRLFCEGKTKELLTYHCYQHQEWSGRWGKRRKNQGGGQSNICRNKV